MVLKVIGFGETTNNVNVDRKKMKMKDSTQGISIKRGGTSKEKQDVTSVIS